MSEDPKRGDMLKEINGVRYMIFSHFRGPDHNWYPNAAVGLECNRAGHVMKRKACFSQWAIVPRPTQE